MEVLTTMELKRKTHRGVGGVKMRNRLVPHPHVVVKNQEGISGVKGPSLTSNTSAQGSTARKISLHNFWL